MNYRFKRYQRFLLDIELDVCDFFGNKTKYQPLIDKMNLFFVNNSLGFHECPMVGRIDFTNIGMDSRALGGIILPIGQYRFDSEGYNAVTKEKLIQSRVYMTVSTGKDDGQMG